MRKFLKNFILLFADFFQFKFVKYYLLIIIGTFIIVMSGFDWDYFIFVQKYIPKMFLFIFDIFGFLFPTLLIIGLFIYNQKKKTEFSRRIFTANFYAVFMALLSSMFIKVFTGRISPPLRGDINTWIDNSHAFQFGFMREQIIGGFPSSHTTVFFALAFTLYYLFPKNKLLHLLSFLIAFSVSLGVTIGFHWFSEFFAGGILGFVIGKIISDHLNNLNKRAL